MSKPFDFLRRWGWQVLKIVAIAIVVGGVVYRAKFAPIAVEAHSVERGPIVAEVLGTGTLEARVSAIISPKISNRIEQVLVDQGDRVLAGEKLVRLDDDELQQQVAIAQASLESEAAAIERLKADKLRAVAVFDQAQTSYTRTQSLLERNAVSQDDVDKATEMLAVAAAGVTHSEAAIAEGQKELVAAEKTIEYHRARLADAEINAPFDGIIVKRIREPGDVVVPGSAILSLISLDELWISAWVDETEMSKLQEGQAARVVFRSEPERTYPGTVVRLGKEADRETREFIVDVRVLELARNWAVGQRAEVFIESARSDDVVLLPANLVMTREGKKGVFTNEGGRAKWTAIEIGLHSRNFVEVVGGLSAGDTVVTAVASQTGVSEGRKVAVQKEPSP